MTLSHTEYKQIGKDIFLKSGGRQKWSHNSLLHIIVHSATLIKQVTVVNGIQEINNKKKKARIFLKITTTDSILIF